MCFRSKTDGCRQGCAKPLPESRTKLGPRLLMQKKQTKRQIRQGGFM